MQMFEHVKIKMLGNNRQESRSKCGNRAHTTSSEKSFVLIRIMSPRSALSMLAVVLFVAPHKHCQARQLLRDSASHGKNNGESEALEHHHRDEMLDLYSELIGKAHLSLYMSPECDVSSVAKLYEKDAWMFVPKAEFYGTEDIKLALFAHCRGIQAQVPGIFKVENNFHTFRAGTAAEDSDRSRHGWCYGTVTQKLHGAGGLVVSHDLRFSAVLHYEETQGWRFESHHESGQMLVS